MQHLELSSIDGIDLDAVVHRAPVASTRGVVLLVHGITVDMDEGGGMFVRLADRLVDAGFNVVRFSFRGHGASGGTQEGITIAGECLDLQAAVAAVENRFPGQRLSIVAASFGAVSVALSLSWLGGLHRLALWNPVLDLAHTFLVPELAWGRENFGPDQQKSLQYKGFLLVDGEFRLGRVLFAEFERYRPVDDLLSGQVAALVVHGDRDESVSYDIAAEFARSRPDTTLHTVAGSDHGFDSREREDEAIGVTVGWLSEQYAVEV
ncbi:alpha/beta hydrolase [Nocardia sp. CS682]|uniref:alpha/beta hydrolase n=1 Tax=Nocardia sp. CS682 TaxID=1047172 RepID=UPI001074ED51|nr:alpha/beta fold hydrolase [Nocardia sp. CS682]QBS41314.1 alpha/beta hydrolase [Nocardia sp. CS682]